MTSRNWRHTDRRTHGRTHRRDRTAGQATVEVALVLPVIVLVLLGVVQVGLVVRDQVSVVHAAREAARSASLGEDDRAVRAAAEAATTLRADRLVVEVDGARTPGARVTASLTYRSPTAVPFIGALIGDQTLTAETTMRVE